MIKAGTRGNSRILAGARAAYAARQSSLLGEDSTVVAQWLNFFGKHTAAKWVDRFFAKESARKQLERAKKDPSAGIIDEKEAKKINKRRKKLEEELLAQLKKSKKILDKESAKDIDEQIFDTLKKEFPSYAKAFSKKESDEEDSTEITTESKTEKGALVGIQKQLFVIETIVTDIRQDVSDIKDLIMPKGVIARNTAGEQQPIQYNPLAPPGEQFKRISEKGAVVGINPSKEHQQDAARKIAKESAILAIKIMEKDRQRAELRKKYEYKDEAEKYKQEDPLDEVKDRLGKIEKKLDEKKKGGFFDMIVGVLLGLWAKMGKKFAAIANGIRVVAGWVGKAWAIGKTVFTFLKNGVMGVIRTISSAIGFLRDRVLIPLWNYIARSPIGKLVGMTEMLAAGAAAAAVAGEAYVLDKSMKQTADKNIDKITSDVTANQKREGFKLEDSYQAYKIAIDKSLASPENASQERQDYIKQQLTTSEGLTDLERRMAARYFYEKEGGAKGPSTRGGARGRKDTIPAEVIAEGSDTVDTNFATTPIAPPKPQVLTPETPKPTPVVATVNNTGSLSKKSKSGLLMPDSTVMDAIDIASKRVGVDKGIMLAMAKQESGFNPSAKAKTSSASGLYQFINSTWNSMVEKYGKQYPELKNGRMDVLASAIAGALFIKENSEVLRKAGIPITGTSIYAAHFLGAGGAKKLLSSDPNTNAVDLMPAAANANKHIFYNKDGSARTTSEVENVLFEKVGKYAALYGDQPVTPTSTIPGARMDGDTRKLQAANSPASISVMGAPTVVNSTQVNQTVGKRPAAKADVLTQDKSLVRTVARDSAHPIYG